VRSAEVSGDLEAQAVDAERNCPEGAVSVSP
jgi:ferredoxin